MSGKISISFAFTVAFKSFLYFSKAPTESEIHPENQWMRGEYNNSFYTGWGFELTIPNQKRMNDNQWSLLKASEC